MGYSIGEAKVWTDIELARAREAKELAYKFKAQPIAPATADIGLFEKIMAKNEKRRAKEHEKKAAYAAAHFKPFDIVNSHCAEAEARAAARRAREALEQKRELEECCKFKANPLNQKAMIPKHLVLVPLKRKKKVVEMDYTTAKEKEVWVEEEVKCWMPTREVGRAERVSAEARASAARASLPPRMALAIDESKRRATERAAALAEEEAAERAAATFHPSPHPDFAANQARFAAACAAHRVAVTSSWKASASSAFSFDTLAAKKAVEADKDAIVREYELSTSRALSVRKRSDAYSKDGADLVGDRPLTAPPRTGKKGTLGLNPLLEATAALSSTAATNKRPGTAGGDLHGSSRSAMGAALHSSSAPPASMTKSARLKLEAVQSHIRAVQEAELRKQKEDEAWYDLDKATSKKLGPTFAALERERLTQEDGSVRQLSWYLDHVTASASAEAQRFKEKSKANAALIRSVVERGQSDRPLVMQRASIEAAKSKAKRSALSRLVKGGGSMENSIFFDSKGGGVMEGLSESEGASAQGAMEQ